METEVQAAFDDILWFVNAHLANMRYGDFEGEDVKVIFNRDMLMNESEIITDCQNSQGIISDETIISMHPWVDDPKIELERLKSQKAMEQEEMMSQYDPFHLQSQEGQEGKNRRGGGVDEE